MRRPTRLFCVLRYVSNWEEWIGRRPSICFQFDNYPMLNEDVQFIAAIQLQAFVDKNAN